jgi:thymidylate synthase (FAD)
MFLGEEKDMKVKLLSYQPLKDVLSRLPAAKLSEKELLGHLSFTFALEGISRACSHQLVRHRVASFSQQSQRYIQVRRLKMHVVAPPSVTAKSPEIFDSLIGQASNAYQALVDAGIPREDARFVLPNATETNLLVTMDGRSLMHFFGLRCCIRAQWEVKELSDEMLRQVRKAEPELFSGAGPYCFQLGRCPEGRFTCGRMGEVVEKYRV